MITTLITIAIAFVSIRIANDFINFARNKWGKWDIEIRRGKMFSSEKLSNGAALYPNGKCCELCGNKDDFCEVQNLFIIYSKRLGLNCVHDRTEEVFVCVDCQKDDVKLLTSSNKHIRMIGQAIAERKITTCFSKYSNIILKEQEGY